MVRRITVLLVATSVLVAGATTATAGKNSPQEPGTKYFAGTLHDVSVSFYVTDGQIESANVTIAGMPCNGQNGPKAVTSTKGWEPQLLRDYAFEFRKAFTNDARFRFSGTLDGRKATGKARHRVRLIKHGGKGPAVCRSGHREWKAHRVNYREWTAFLDRLYGHH